MNKEEFFDSLDKLGIKITNKQKKQLDTYYKMLVEKNKVMNLTGITDEEQVYLKHFYDSATIVRGLDLSKENTLCDIGTGAGFPGLVLKILFPNLEVTLVDSLQKRLNFLQEVIDNLALEKINLVHSRAEDYARKNREIFDVVAARAVAPLNILIEYCTPLIKPGKYFVSMKGNISQEIKSIDRCINKVNAKVLKIEQFLLPKENSNRSLIIISKDTKTDLKYPRKNSEIKKNPL